MIVPGELLRIEAVELFRSSGTLSQRAANAHSVWQARAGVAIELRDDAGHLGVGEAAPLPGFSRESLHDCERALAALGACELRCEESGWPSLPAPVFRALPAARFAWETAVADLLARRRGVSVASWLRGTVVPSAARVPLSGLLSTGTDLVEAGRVALLHGVRTLKVKVGAGDAAAELAALVALRATLGDGFRLRLDANGSWSPPQARERLAALAAARLDIELVEQPVPPGQLVGLGPCALPWAADESLQDADEAQALAQAAGCAAFVIKPAALGLRQAQRLAMLAAQSGRGVIVTHLFDGPIGLAAACELALSIPDAVLACGLEIHAGLTAWPVVALPHHRDSKDADGAVITATGRSGLGFARAGLPWC